MPRRLLPLLCLTVLLVACGRQPFARISGLLVDARLDEVSGMAASRAHADVLWMLDDGGNAANLYAVSRRGRKLATYTIAGAPNTDWEDLAAFELDGRHYLLIADTGDNGGLRRTLQLHVVEEPRDLRGGTLRPAWSIAFRWPDGARDCEAVAVDAARRQVLLVSKKRQPPELFALSLTPTRGQPQVALRIGLLAGVPTADARQRLADPAGARLVGQVTAADLSPDGRTLAVLTYQDLLLYRRAAKQDWAQAAAGMPWRHPVPWLPQAEALAWTASGGGLYASGEFSPAPLLYLTPDAPQP